MPRGTLIRLPTEAAAIETPAYLLDRMAIAWRVWFIEGYKLANGIKFSEEDVKFMKWVTTGNIEGKPETAVKCRQ